MKCLETRKRDGMKWRRYRTDDGRIVTTFEMPTQVVNLSSDLRRRLAMWESKQQKLARKEQAKQLLAEGWKTTAVANHFGLSDSWVRQIRRVAFGKEAQ
jgi:hypothetical protein